MIGDRIEVNIAGGLDIPLPRMVHVRQKFQTNKLDSVTRTVAEQFKRAEVRAKVKPGMSIAVGCGSRGINNIAECAKAVVTELKALGAKPFIFPAVAPPWTWSSWANSKTGCRCTWTSSQPRPTRWC